MNLIDHKKIEEFMSEAGELARQSVRDFGGGPFGAVVVANNIVVGRGRNNVTIKNDPTAHAEIVAIRDACAKKKTFDLKGHVIFSSCEPCPMCLSAIYWSHIDNIFYANNRNDAKKINFDDSLIYSEIKKEFKDRKIPMKQMMRDKAIEAFEIWDKKTDKIEY